MPKSGCAAIQEKFVAWAFVPAGVCAGGSCILRPRV
jgi:hypothetical protein